jgi:hypothetical protein
MTCFSFKKRKMKSYGIHINFHGDGIVRFWIAEGRSAMMKAISRGLFSTAELLEARKILFEAFN